MSEQPTASMRQHLGDTARSAVSAAQAGLHHTRNALRTADGTVSAAIKEHGGVWGAMKHGAGKHPVTAAFVAATALLGTLYVGHKVFGHHTDRLANERAPSGDRSR